MVMQWHVLSSENSLISLLVCDLDNGQPLTFDVSTGAFS